MVAKSIINMGLDHTICQIRYCTNNLFRLNYLKIPHKSRYHATLPNKENHRFTPLVRVERKAVSSTDQKPRLFLELPLARYAVPRFNGSRGTSRMYDP